MPPLRAKNTFFQENFEINLTSIKRNRHLTFFKQERVSKFKMNRNRMETHFDIFLKNSAVIKSEALVQKCESILPKFVFLNFTILIAKHECF